MPAREPPPAPAPLSGRSPELGDPSAIEAAELVWGGGNADLVRASLWLMRARWRIAWNSLRRSAPWRQLMGILVSLAVAFLAFVSLVVSYALTRFIVGVTESPVPADVVVATAFSGGMLLSLMVSFTVALAALFLSKDFDLLLAAPIARRAVFASKLIGGVTPAQLVILGLTLVPLVGHGLAMGAYDEPWAFYDWSYYAAVLAALALLPVIPVSIGAVAVVLIVRRVSAHRLGDVVGLIVVAMALSIALVAGSARQLREMLTVSDLLAAVSRVRSPYSPAEWLTLAVTAAGRHEWAVMWRWFGLTAVVSALALLPLGAVSDRRYYEGWLHMQSTQQTQHGRASSRLPWARTDRAADLGRPSGFLRWLTPPTVALIRKDWRVIPRDLTSIAQVLAPLSVGLFFILQQLLYPVRIGGSDFANALIAPLLAMLSAGIATGVSAMIMARFGLTAFSLEGKAYWVLGGAPIDRRELVAGKFLVAYIPYLLLGTALVVLLEVARAVSDARMFGDALLPAVIGSLRPGLLAYALFVMAVVGAGVIAITLSLGAARPNLRWDSPHEMLTPDVGCLSLVLYGGYAMIAGLTLALPAAASPFAMIRYPVVLWAFGLALGLGLTAFVVVGAYWLAVREVEGIGE